MTLFGITVPNVKIFLQINAAKKVTGTTKLISLNSNGDPFLLLFYYILRQDGIHWKREGNIINLLFSSKRLTNYLLPIVLIQCPSL